MIQPKSAASKKAPPQKPNPRILVVTPEVTYLPDRMGRLSKILTLKAGGLADVSAALISALNDLGADVHVAIPDYRNVYREDLAPFLAKEQRWFRSILSSDRLHLASDSAFFHRDHIYGYGGENVKIALAFQREVINNIVPRVRPDLIHCNDWMTGLIPAMAREMGVYCLFTIHNIHTVKAYLSHIEDRGIDVVNFLKWVFQIHYPRGYDLDRDTNPVDFLVSGVFAAHFVNTVSPTFLREIIEGRHAFVEEPLRRELSQKVANGCATGILNAPDPSFNPKSDRHLVRTYTVKDAFPAKAANKLDLQQQLGLIQDPRAPLFFWPSRLDPIQKGCQLLADILYSTISRYWDRNLQVVFVADGEFKPVFRDIVDFHGFHQRVAVCDFSEQLERRCYAASDFILMPSLFEPCGLPQMIAPIYGSLPVVHDTGGLHDTISHLDVDQNKGNGFVFTVYDAMGLAWAIDRAMDFHALPDETRMDQIGRIMAQSARTFTYAETAKCYIDLYEQMLDRPLLR